MSTEKLFPLKLPQNFHGQAKKYETPSDLYLKKTSQKEVFDPPASKVSKWQRKIYDRDVLQERREFLVHPAKISSDNPDWLKSTSHYYHRSEFTPAKRQTLLDKKKFDVLGNKKSDIFAYKSESFPVRQSTIKKSYPEVTSKIGCESIKHTSLYKIKATRTSEVTQKIGFNQNRETVVKRPQLKVGSLYEKNFVDTYSIN